MEKLLALVVSGLGIALIIYVYFLFFKMTVAIWIPRYAKTEWIEKAELSKTKFGYFFYKWVASIWIVLVTINIVLELVLYLLKSLFVQ